METQFVTLENDCPATIIPAGDQVTLRKGSEIQITQSLGGSLTVQHQGILYRIDSKDTGKIGSEEVAALVAEKSNSPALEGGEPTEFRESLLWEALKSCYDPEIPINIVDLGLIYDLKYSEVSDSRYSIEIKMTLTAQGCGMGPVIADDARSKLEALSCVSEANVEIVWDPPWTPHMISEEGRAKLGIEV